MTAARLNDRRNTLVATLLFVLAAASPAAAGTLTLMWDANVEQVTGYAVYQGSSPGVYTSRTDVGNTLTHTVQNAVSGQRYCFAVAAYVDPAAEGPKSAEVCGYSDQTPTLVNPGNQSSTTGQAATLQLSATDPDGQPISYSATGLPPGLTLTPSTGFISGAGTTPGVYAVQAYASDGTLSAMQAFTWTMTAATTSDTTAPVVTIAAPTSSPTYAATSATISLTGTASDDAAVTLVSWASSAGGSGTASGTTNWGVASIALQAGTNVITISARDAAGNVGTDVLTVSYAAPDTAAPTVQITSPTTSTRYDTLFANVTLAGVVSDESAIQQVRWSNDRGGSGTASGGNTWSVASVILQPGDNVIVVTAVDAAGNQGTDALTVVYTVPDLTAPSVDILDPTSQDDYTTEALVVSLSGVAQDDVEVVDITWSNNRGGNGRATGTSSWYIPSLTLQTGINVVTVKARDKAGNESIDVLTVDTQSPPPAPATLRVDIWTNPRWTRSTLTWSGLEGRSVDIYRNGSRIAVTANGGSYFDQIRDGYPSSYQVCASGTATCTNLVNLSR